jgi:CBS domain-containing protein
MENMTAKEVMQTEIETVPDVMPVRDLAAFLVDREISGAPVTDREGRLIGVVSLTDIAEGEAETGGATEAAISPYFATGWERRLNLDDFKEVPLENRDLLVRDIMTPTLYTVPEDTPVARVARTMITGRVHRLLVTRNERVTGIVASFDLLKLLCE